MRECDPEDQLADLLIRLRSHITVSQNTNNEIQALDDVFQGMTDTLKFVVLSRSPRYGLGMDDRKKIANRTRLAIEGIKKYYKFQIRRVEAFACCVEAISGDIESERESIKVVKEKATSELKELADAITSLRSSTSDQDLMKVAEHLLQQSYPAFQNRSVNIRNVDERLREKATLIINMSWDKDALVSKIVKGLALPSQDDPGAADPV